MFDNADLMRRALEYSRGLPTGGLPIIDHCEEKHLAIGADMHEGWVSTRLGLAGTPAVAEEAMVARDIALGELTGARLHLAHISTAGSIQLIKEAKERGLDLSAEVTPHHIALSHELIMTDTIDGSGGLAYNTNAKVNPPLRTPVDIAACASALADGTIDCVATDHAPHAIEDKLCEFDSAAYGISGLETALALCLSLVHNGDIDLPTLIERMTIGPVKALGLNNKIGGLGTLMLGAPGDVSIFDPDTEWTVNPDQFASKGKNTPVAGHRLRGRVTTTIYGGDVAYQL